MTELRELPVTASRPTLLRQAVGFGLDLALICLPVFVHPGFVTIGLMLVLWFLYIPLCEYRYGRTLGMAMVGTRIHAIDGGEAPLSAVLRRHLGRISLVWGVVGWLSLFAGFRIAEDYLVLREGELPPREVRYGVSPKAQRGIWRMFALLGLRGE